ncbi:MAG: hypothetical protein WD738_23910 [Pirellulales bacterium]
MTVAANKDFISIGALAAHLQRPVRRIELAVAVLQIEPAMRLNGIVHFDADQVERIALAIVMHDAKTNPVKQRADSLQ